MILTVCVLLMMLALCTSSADDGPLPQFRRETFNCSPDGSRWSFLLQSAEGKPGAVLLNLYGHYSDEYQGMTEGPYENAFGRLRRECLRRNWAYVCPYYGGNSWMGPLAESGMADLIGLLRKRWPDTPVYCSGGSMGGSSTMVLATVRPDLVDGVLARCPACDMVSYYDFVKASSNSTLQNIAAAIRIHYTVDGRSLEDELRKRSAALNAERLTMPVYLCHGARDTIIPVDGTRRLAQRLEELGRPVCYVELPEGDHNAPVVQADWVQALDFISQGTAR